MFILLPLFAEIVTDSEGNTTQASHYLQRLSLPAAFFFLFFFSIYATGSLEKPGKTITILYSVKLFRKAVSEDTLLTTQPEFWTAKAACWNFYPPMHQF